jgi:membrane associated rhomboid family serine protease
MVYFFFFFPIGADVTLRRRPWVTVGLVSACVLAYLATRFLPDGPRLLYQLAWKPRSPSLLTAVTSCFMHAGLVHLIGNMLYLAFLGPPVEDRLGRRRFLLLYLVTGACAMVAQALVIQWRAPDLAGSPVIGASGAVAGVLGAFMIRLPSARIRVITATLFLLHGINKVAVKLVPAVLAVVFWVILQLAWALTWADVRTAYWSHLSGIAIGAGIAISRGAWHAGRLERHRQRGVRYLEQGSFYAAVGELDAMFAKGGGGDPEDHGMHGRALVAAGRRPAAIQAFRRAIGIALDRGEKAAALRHYLEMQRLLPATVLEPRDQLRVASALRREGEFEAAAIALGDFTRAYPGTSKTELARLLTIEIRAGVLGDVAGARELGRAADPRLLPERWRERLQTWR